MAQYIGLVLAGGRGRRMGRPKGGLEIEGKALAGRAADTLAPICERVVISLAPGMANPVPGRPAVFDAEPAGRGPLAGIHAALEATEAGELLVLACDYPVVDAALLERIAARAQLRDDVVLPLDSKGREHPLVALWRRRTAGRIDEALGAGSYGVRALLRGLSVRRLVAADLGGLDLDRALLNVNRPGDLPSEVR